MGLGIGKLKGLKEAHDEIEEENKRQSQNVELVITETGLISMVSTVEFVPFRDELIFHYRDGSRQLYRYMKVKELE